LSRRAVQVASGYSWEIVADDIEALFAELGCERNA